jgi:hypothetical protein
LPVQPLIARHSGLFTLTQNGQTSTPGWPTCGDGWRGLVETAVGRIADAVAAAPAGSLRIVQVKENSRACVFIGKAPD